MGTSYKRLGGKYRALNRIFEGYAKKARSLVLEYSLEHYDHALASPQWLPLGAESTRDVILAAKARDDYRDALKGYNVDVRIVARYVNPEPFAMVGWPNIRRQCDICGNQITVNADLRFVTHGRLVAHLVGPNGKVKRISQECIGSGMGV